MKLKAPLLVAILVVCAVAAPAARAQNRSESWEFGPYLVGFDFDRDIEIEDRWGGGFRFGYNFVPMHEVELSFEGVETQDDVFNQIDVSVGQFQANYVFNFIFDRHQPVVPYFTAGIGAIHFEVDDPVFGTDDETDPLFSIGGGVRFFIGKVFNFRIDARAVSFSGDNVVLSDRDFTNNQLSIGVGWVVGGR
jgi:outer membrane protein with beta-barrel domain